MVNLQSKAIQGYTPGSFSLTDSFLPCHPFFSFILSSLLHSDQCFHEHAHYVLTTGASYVFWALKEYGIKTEATNGE